jgi:hypothetical protein
MAKARATNGLSASSDRPSTLEALEAFLVEHPPTGAGKVRAALALKLATELETVPKSVLNRHANALNAIVAELEAGVEPEADAEANLSWLHAEAS